MKILYSTLSWTASNSSKTPVFAKSLQHITKKCRQCESIILVDSPEDIRYMADLDTGHYYYGYDFLLYATCPVCNYAMLLEGYLHQGSPATQIRDNIAKAGPTHALRDWVEDIPLALRTKAYRKWEKEQTPEFWETYFSHPRMQRWIQEHPRDARKLQARLLPQGPASSYQPY